MNEFKLLELVEKQEDKFSYLNNLLKLCKMRISQMRLKLNYI